MVPTASMAPVTDVSSWVTPCWMRSPTTISSSSSKAVISASSRLPSARVSIQRKK